MRIIPSCNPGPLAGDLRSLPLGRAASGAVWTPQSGREEAARGPFVEALVHHFV
jgi:hypothetical protein